MLFFREFPYRARFAPLSSTYANLMCSVVPLIHPSPAESTMVSSSSLQNTLSNPLASRLLPLVLPSLDSVEPNFSQMFTPSGRFQPDKKICFSMSDFHPGTVRYLFKVQSLCQYSCLFSSGTQRGVWQQCKFTFAISRQVRDDHF